ncbi:MAG: hypothetical protein BJ554DRAFT_7770, partial [Olpidium bornovanus]
RTLRSSPAGDVHPSTRFPWRDAVFHALEGRPSFFVVPDAALIAALAPTLLRVDLRRFFFACRPVLRPEPGLPATRARPPPAEVPPGNRICLCARGALRLTLEMTAHDSDAPGTLPAQAGETPPRRVCDAAAGGFRGSTSTSPSGTQDSRSSSRRLAGLCAGAETPGPPASCGEFDLDDLTLDEARVRLRDTLNLLKQKDNGNPGRIETLSNDRDKLLSRLTAAAAPPPGFHAFEAEDASFSSGLDLTVTSLPAHVAARETANKERCEELETKVDDLERSNADLAARLAHAAQQRHELEKSTEKKLAEMREDLESAKSAVEAEAQRAQEAEEEKKRLAKEKAALLKDRKSAATADAEIERLVRNVDDLETSVQELTIAKKELDERLCAERSSRKDLELRCSDYQEQLDELRHLKNDYEAQSAQLNEVNLALEDSRATANALQAVLDKLSPRSESGPDPGGKTLFSEVEDRRAELESKHHSLSQRHVGLIKAHSMTVHQQERLKNHISR